MENCIACGTPTDSIFTLYEVGVGNVENKESRTEYFTEGRSKIRRVHYKIITSLEGVTEHRFGYCKKCLSRDRRFGLRLLLLVTPAFFVPAVLLFLHARGSGSGILSLPGTGSIVLGFIGMIIIFIAAHYIFTGKRSLPYDAKKPEFDDRYLEEHRCRVLTPSEYEYFRKHDMKDIKSKIIDYPA